MPYAFGAGAALALCLPFIQSGCATTACITLKSSDHGKCPSVSGATSRFVDSTCGGGMITSVDGEGDLQDGLCCYPVTQNNNSDELPGCAFGSGGFGGFGDTGGGFAVGGSGGVGGVGGSPCGTCAQVLDGEFPFDPSQLCPESATFLSEVSMCACATSNNCELSCSDNLCMASAASQSCFSCLAGDLSCMGPLDNCVAN